MFSSRLMSIYRASSWCEYLLFSIWWALYYLYSRFSCLRWRDYFFWWILWWWNELILWLLLLWSRTMNYFWLSWFMDRDIFWRSCCRWDRQLLCFLTSSWIWRWSCLFLWLFHAQQYCFYIASTRGPCVGRSRFLIVDLGVSSLFAGLLSILRAGGLRIHRHCGLILFISFSFLFIIFYQSWRGQLSWILFIFIWVLEMEGRWESRRGGGMAEFWFYFGESSELFFSNFDQTPRNEPPSAVYLLCGDTVIPWFELFTIVTDKIDGTFRRCSFLHKKGTNLHDFDHLKVSRTLFATYFLTNLMKRRRVPFLFWHVIRIDQIFGLKKRKDQPVSTLSCLFFFIHYY